MKNKYVDFISDEHLLYCVGNLYKSYLKAKNNRYWNTKLWQSLKVSS
jgi:hypothetical protein